MKTKHIFVLCTLALLALACNNDERATSLDGLVAINATYETPSGTRASIDNGTGVFFWSEGDEIALYTTAYKFVKFKETSITEDKKTASFAGVLVGADLNTYGVFPASLVEANKTNVLPQESDTLTLTLPTTYTYVKDQLNAPMLAKSTDNLTYPFKHLGGVLWLKIKGVPTNTKYLKVETTRKITGTFTVDVSETNPTINLDDADATTDNSVTIEFSDPTEKAGRNTEAQDFYIPLPVGSYPQFTISFLDSNNQVIVIDNFTYTHTIIPTETVPFNLGRRDLARYYFTINLITGTGEEMNSGDLSE